MPDVSDQAQSLLKLHLIEMQPTGISPLGSRTLLREQVSQADGQLLLWMYTLQVIFKLVTNNKIVTAPSPWSLVATNWRV